VRNLNNPYPPRSARDLGSRLRCVDGVLYEHRPQPDDYDFEIDIAKCPDCDGRGCDEEVIETDYERACADLERGDHS
jgi:hypothetical protein